MKKIRKSAAMLLVVCMLIASIPFAVSAQSPFAVGEEFFIIEPLSSSGNTSIRTSAFVSLGTLWLNLLPSRAAAESQAHERGTLASDFVEVTGLTIPRVINRGPNFTSAVSVFDHHGLASLRGLGIIQRNGIEGIGDLTVRR